ncbi:hypothetical protein [Streptomyces sp. NPDC014894]|uniref:hypothetical protein n=1 Tax=Streptomyces sp. NPDC014894 TaxID=3364931 RepID=UPI0036F9E307
MTVHSPIMASSGPSLWLRPLRKALMTRGWSVEVPVTELAVLAAGTDAARSLRAHRGFLYDSDRTAALARLLEESPEDFGAVGTIVLGADEVNLVPGASGPFAAHLRAEGVECIDGLQRLRVIAAACAVMDPSMLANTIVRLEILVGAERERARRLHDTADRFTNLRTAQDRLVRCPNIARLMNANWERGSFEPRRGMTSGPNGLSYSMVDVTRALACFSGPGPQLAHEASTPEGMEILWGDQTSTSYRTLFHSGMEPVGIARAAEAWWMANKTLEELPLSRRSCGHGHLVKYAPQLICWEALRFLPHDELHSPASTFHWDEAIRTSVRDAVLAATDRLIARYEFLIPKKHHYVTKAPQLSLWESLVD